MEVVVVVEVIVVEGEGPRKQLQGWEAMEVGKFFRILEVPIGYL